MKAGKDRTGLVSMLLLLLAGVDKQVRAGAGQCSGAGMRCTQAAHRMRGAGRHPTAQAAPCCRARTSPNTHCVCRWPCLVVPARQAVVRDYAASEALLRESREKARLLGLQPHLTTDQARLGGRSGSCRGGAAFQHAGWKAFPRCNAALPPPSRRQVISAAARVMSDTIARLEGRWGSAHNYLRSIGLSEGELAAVARNLTQPGLELPAAAAAGSCQTAAD